MDIASLLGYDTSRPPTTRKIGFRDNDKIVIRGVDYRSRGRSAFGVALKRMDEDSTELFSFENIREMLDDPERPMVVHRNFYRDEAGGKPKKSTWLDVTSSRSSGFYYLERNVGSRRNPMAGEYPSTASSGSCCAET